MVAHRLQIWLDEHGLADIGPNLAEQGIDRLEDVWSLEKDDLAELGIPEGYVNRLLQAMGSEVAGRVSILDSDVLPVVAMTGTEIPSTMGSLGSAAPTGLEFAQLNRAGAVSGRPKRRARGSIHGRSKNRSAADRPKETRGGSFAAIAEGAEESPLRFQGCSKLQAFLRATGLDHLTGPLKEMGIEMYDDLLDFSQEDFESLGLEQHEELFHALHGARGQP